MKSESKSGIGFGGALTLIFITLKLMGYIHWSWWWVLCPVWIPIAFVATLALAYGIISLIEDTRS